ncbi:MAG: UDP-N-acetylmuramoyl-L-alanine--D-glutamate ligase [Synergistaceae bacterium]|nr:UDP-N-acetylmuramoyl-L-alanine--D-glutamate ligase [Synergistaceae bacterium]
MGGTNFMPKLTVIGAGVSGQGLALLAKSLGENVFVSEQKTIPEEVKTLFAENNIDYEEGHSHKVFDGTSEILISSGIPPQAKILQEAQARGLKLTGELDYVLPHIRAKSLVCITGSNGKSTVTSLTGHILSRAGLKAGTGGNLGTASAKFTQEDFDAVVLELSSFQLARATQNLRSQVSIITNLAPDHLDWHGNYESYVEAKSRVLTLRDPNGWGTIQDRDAETLNPSGKIITLSWTPEPQHKFSGHIFMGSDYAVLTLGGKTHKLFNYSDTTLIGSHNLENVAMSLCAVYLLGVEGDAKALLEGFRPLPHRCENAGTVDGVLYVDDSKGTNVAASITAMTSIPGRKVIILGGQGKGENYSPLAEAVKSECDSAVLLGAEAGKIQEALERAGFREIHRVSTMEEAVKLSQTLARAGMVVLLSPACTSWDMYKSYKARGEDFCRAVKKLTSQS